MISDRTAPPPSTSARWGPPPRRRITAARRFRPDSPAILIPLRRSVYQHRICVHTLIRVLHNLVTKPHVVVLLEGAGEAVTLVRHLLSRVREGAEVLQPLQVVDLKGTVAVSAVTQRVNAAAEPRLPRPVLPQPSTGFSLPLLPPVEAPLEQTSPPVHEDF